MRDCRVRDAGLMDYGADMVSAQDMDQLPRAYLKGYDMKNRYLTAAVASSLPALASDDAFAIDLVDADLDAVAGGSTTACGVMNVDCKGTFKSSSIEAE